MSAKQSRREFLKSAGVGAAVSLAAGCAATTVSENKQCAKKSCKSLKLGLTTYTFREFNLEQAVAMTRRVGLEYICLKDLHLPLDSGPEKIAEVTKMVRGAGLKLYGGGVIYMRSEEAVNGAFAYAKAAGMKTITAMPSEELLTLVEKNVRRYDIRVAIHNHGPGDELYPTPASIYRRVRDMDKRVGICMDIGHTMRAGVDPCEAAERFGYRLLDIHIKDVTAATKEGKTVEIGRGVIDIPRFVGILVDMDYSGVVSFEYEKDAKDPLAGLAESVGYVKGVLATV